MIDQSENTKMFVSPIGGGGGVGSSGYMPVSNEIIEENEQSASTKSSFSGSDMTSMLQPCCFVVAIVCLPLCACGALVVCLTACMQCVTHVLSSMINGCVGNLGNMCGGITGGLGGGFGGGAIGILGGIAKKIF